jgi:hypothetical protein
LIDAFGRLRGLSRRAGAPAIVERWDFEPSTSSLGKSQSATRSPQLAKIVRPVRLDKSGKVRFG